MGERQLYLKRVMTGRREVNRGVDRTDSDEERKLNVGTWRNRVILTQYKVFIS